jgi:hypothetical protein
MSLALAMKPAPPGLLPPRLAALFIPQVPFEMRFSAVNEHNKKHIINLL